MTKTWLPLCSTPATRTARRGMLLRLRYFVRSACASAARTAPAACAASAACAARRRSLLNFFTKEQGVRASHELRSRGCYTVAARARSRVDLPSMTALPGCFTLGGVSGILTCVVYVCVTDWGKRETPLRAHTRSGHCPLHNTAPSLSSVHAQHSKSEAATCLPGPQQPCWPPPLPRPARRRWPAPGPRQSACVRCSASELE